MRQPKTRPLAPLISLKKLSQKSISLASLLQLANNHQSFDSLLEQCLPDSYQGRFKINGLHNNTLILSCSSAKLMTQFRFIQDSVIDTLNPLIAPKHINSIQIKIRPNITKKEPKQKNSTPQRNISKKNAQILLEEAEHTEDQNLRNVLTNLANRTNQN